VLHLVVDHPEGGATAAEAEGQSLKGQLVHSQDVAVHVESAQVLVDLATVAALQGGPVAAAPAIGGGHGEFNAACGKHGFWAAGPASRGDAVSSKGP